MPVAPAWAWHRRHSVPKAERAAALAHAGFSEAALAGFVEMNRGIDSGHITFSGPDAAERPYGQTSLDQAIGTMPFVDDHRWMPAVE